MIWSHVNYLQASLLALSLLYKPSSPFIMSLLALLIILSSLSYVVLLCWTTAISIISLSLWSLSFSSLSLSLHDSGLSEPTILSLPSRRAKRRSTPQTLYLAIWSFIFSLIMSYFLWHDTRWKREYAWRVARSSL